MVSLKDDALPSFQGPSTPAGSVADLQLSAEEMRTIGAIEAENRLRLKNEKKVSVHIPRSVTGGLPLKVSYNGVQLEIPVGVVTEVPQSIADILAPRIAAEAGV